jgi:hypothetical protein
MRRVSQLDKDGCGIACVAMIAGVSYREAQNRMFPDGKVTTTMPDAIRKAMKLYKIACTKTQRGNYRRLGQNAILRTRRRADGDWHWLVWDACRKDFIDPEKCTDDRYIRPPVTSFIPIKRKGKRPPQSK